MLENRNKNRINTVLLLVFSCIFIIACNNKNTTKALTKKLKRLELRANNITEFKEHLVTINKINDQDVDIILANGRYENVVVTLDITNSSQFQKRILAESSGKVTLEGQLYFGMTGQNISIQGFNLVRKKSYGKATPFVAFKSARNCAVKNTNFKELKELAQEKKAYTYYVGFSEGFRNKVSGCRFEDKVVVGSYIVMHYVSKEGKNGNHHIIEDNYFGPRAYTDRPSDTAIRLGGSGRWDAETAHIDVGVMVRNNTFDNYDAYYETISVKSTGNYFINNTFIGCNGYLCLRNAADCIIKGNKFLGKNEQGTRGVRIQGPGHIIENNYFQNLNGSALWIWGGNGKIHYNPTKENPMPLYINTENVQIVNNSIINCQYPIKLSFLSKINNTVLPKNILVKGNFISGDRKTEKIVYLDVKGCSPDVKKLESNFVSSENVISKKAYSVFDANLFELGKNTIEQENNLKFSKKGNYYYHSVRKDGVGYLEKNSKSKN